MIQFIMILLFIKVKELIREASISKSPNSIIDFGT